MPQAHRAGIYTRNLTDSESDSLTSFDTSQLHFAQSKLPLSLLSGSSCSSCVSADAHSGPAGAEDQHPGAHPWLHPCLISREMWAGSLATSTSPVHTVGSHPGCSLGLLTAPFLFLPHSSPCRSEDSEPSNGSS